MKHYFTLIFLLIEFTSIKAIEITKKDTSASIKINVIDSFSITQDDYVLKMIDEAIQTKYKSNFPLITDTNILDKVGYCPDSIPEFSSAYYAQKLAELDKQTPFQLSYNNKVESFIKLYTLRRRGLTSRLLGMKHTYFPLFEAMLDKYNLPLEFKYLAVVESALRPEARSHAGAVGLWQFIYSTGKMYKLQINSYVDERSDAYKSTEAACKYFTHLYQLYGNWELVMAAYNCGPGNVNKAIRRSGGKKDYWSLWSYLPRETRSYVPAFIAVNYVMNNASAHNLYPVKPHAIYYDYDTVQVHQAISFKQLSESLDIPVAVLTKLNPAYRRGFIPDTKHPQNLFLPRNKIGLYVTNETLIYKLQAKQEIKIPAQLKEEFIVHRVKSGEVLGSIANKYRVRVSDIKRWNNLRNSRINIRQKLRIYTPYGIAKHTNNKKGKASPVALNSQYYIIKKGDTLWDIAKAAGTTAEKLKRLNKVNSKRLKPGDKLKLS